MRVHVRVVVEGMEQGDQGGDGQQEGHGQGGQRAAVQPRPRRGAAHDREDEHHDHGRGGGVAAGPRASQAVAPDGQGGHRRREGAQAEGHRRRAHDEQDEKGRSEQEGEEAQGQVTRGHERPRAAHLHPVDGQPQRFSARHARAEGEAHGPAHLAQIDRPHAPAARRLRPSVHLPSLRLDGHLRGKGGEAGQAHAGEEVAGADADGQLQPRAVLGPAEHGLAAAREPVPLPPLAEAAREGGIAGPDVDEQGRRALQPGRERTQSERPGHGEEERAPDGPRGHSAFDHSTRVPVVALGFLKGGSLRSLHRATRHRRRRGPLPPLPRRLRRDAERGQPAALAVAVPREPRHRAGGSRDLGRPRGRAGARAVRLHARPPLVGRA